MSSHRPNIRSKSHVGTSSNPLASSTQSSNPLASSTSTPAGTPSQPQVSEATASVQASENASTPENKSRPREGEHAEEDEDPLVTEAKKRLRTTRSDVWNEFNRIVGIQYVAGKKEVLIQGVCSHCQKKIEAASAKGTSRLAAHLRTCKKKLENQSGQRKITSVQTGNQVSKLANWKYDPLATRSLIAKMIAKHDYPITMVEHGYFREFVKSLNPSARMYSRNTTREDIMKVYQDLKDELQEEFDDLTSKYSLTTDMWSCKHTKNGYCCVTCHWIDNEWKMHKKTLCYILVPSPHTGEILADFVKTVVLEWNIDTKLFAIIADNASANNVMMRNLKSWLDGKDCLVNGDMFHGRCSNHILHLVVLEGMKVAADFIESIRDCVKYVRSSQARKERFANALSQVRLGSRSVNLDVDTIWNSTFQMLKNSIELRQGFIRLSELDSDFQCLPTSVAWQQGINICECLQVFDDVSTKFAGIKYPTANMYYNGVYEVNKSIKQWESSPHMYISEMGVKMRAKFDSYWKECNLLISIGVVLDPRYKEKWVEFVYKKLYGAGVEYSVEYGKFRTSLNNLFSAYESSSTTPDYFGNSNSASGSGSNNENSRLNNEYDEFWMLNSDFEVQKTELEKYLEESLLTKGSPTDELKFDILSWWKIHGPKYPTLAKIARDVLAVPVTSVASESMFSAGGRVLTTHRSSLAPECVQALLCISDWLPDIDSSG